MILKKIILIALITATFATPPAKAANLLEIRTQALALLGVALGIGGIHQLIKRSESNTYRLCDIISGALFLTAGASTIILSGQFIQEIDARFS